MFKMEIYWSSVIKLVVYKTTFIMVFLTKGNEHLIFWYIACLFLCNKSKICCCNLPYFRIFAHNTIIYILTKTKFYIYMFKRKVVNSLVAISKLLKQDVLVYVSNVFIIKAMGFSLRIWGHSCRSWQNKETLCASTRPIMFIYLELDVLCNLPMYHKSLFS